MLTDRSKEKVCPFRRFVIVSVYLHIGSDESSHKEAPGCALMIGFVTLLKRTKVDWVVFPVLAGEGTKSSCGI